ncbi:MAG: protein kinase [Planctomycetaceae bacterium]|nr:protein kinase [Planctomycetaceae bacterium]
MLKRGFQFAPGYRLQEFLGRGQFGQVWRATAPGGAACAAKFIDLSDGQGQKEYDAVKRVKQIRHANLMPITAIWLLDGEGKVVEEAPNDAIETIDLSVLESEASGIHNSEVEPSWLVVAMLLGGKSLQARLRECVKKGLPGIPPKELISYMDESAKGIDFLNAPQHDLGEGPIAIQHSDIKPANIVLIGSSAVVCDFGLARILTRNQVTATSAAGTPAYMAPESISGKPARSSDQYGLAVTYYHLRTGTLPVNDGSLWEVLDAHRHGNLEFGLIPEAEQAVLRKATELNWEARFDSCVEMVDALREALRSGGETKPNFVSPGQGQDVNPSGGKQTQQVGDDPTATLDLPTSENSSDQAFEMTAPFVNADRPTEKEGFKKETLPGLDQHTGATSPGAIQALPWTKNKWLVGGLGTGVIFILLFIATIFDGGGQGDGSDPPPPTPTPVFEELYAEALSSLASDPAAAKTKFSEALALQPNWQAPVKLLKGHTGAVFRIAQNATTQHLVSIGESATPLLWDLDALSIEPTQLAGHESILNDLAILPSGSRLLTGGLDSVARVWNLDANDASSTPITLSLHSSGIEAVAWRGMQPTAATASSDLTLGIWTIGPPSNDHPAGTIEEERQLSIGQSLVSLASDLKGKYLAARTNGSDPVSPQPDVIVYSWEDLVNQPGVPNSISLKTRTAKQIAMLPQLPMVVTGDYGGAIRLYEIADGKASVKMQIEEHKADVEALRVISVDDINVIVSGSVDGSVCRWQYGNTSNITKRQLSDQSVNCIDVSTDGRWVAAGFLDNTLWLLDADEADQSLGAYRITVDSSVDSVVINQEQNLLIGGCEDGVIRVWNLNDLKLLLMADPTPAASTEVDRQITIETTPVT